MNQYVYGAGLTAMEQSGNRYYLLADGLGSTMAVVDSSGNSQKSYGYDVSGEVTRGAGSLSNEFDFAGQQTDGTGWRYLRARYYDSETGSFERPLGPAFATLIRRGAPARRADSFQKESHQCPQKTSKPSCR